jgi:hypothetical protein
MEIKVVAEPQAPPRRITPEELSEGRSTVTVWLEKSITLQVENCICTYSPGEHQAPCVIANILAAQQGAEIVRADGSFLNRDVPKPAAQTRYPSPFSGTKRWKI